MSADFIPDKPGDFIPDSQFQADEEKYGGLKGMISAPIFGALRGLTLGLSDVAATKSGLFKPEDIKGIQEHNPGLSLTGEIGSAFVPGGAANLIGKAGKATYTGVKALKAAKTAQEMTMAAKVLGATGEIAAQAAGSAVEGAIYSGVGNTLNEYALGDPSLNGEKVLANFGNGALFGGMLGGGLKAASIAAPPAIKAARDGLAKVRDVLIGTGEGSAGLVGRFMPEGKISEAIANRAINLDSDGKIAIARETADNFNNVHKNIETSLKELNKDIRPKEAAALIRTADPEKVLVAQQDIVNAMNQTVEKMKGRPAVYSQSAAAKLEDLRDDIVGAMKNKDPLDVFNKLKESKQKLGKMVFTKIPTEQTEDTLNALRPVSAMVNETIKNPDIFGHVGASLAAHDEVMSKYFDFIAPGAKSARGATDFQKAFGSFTGKGQKATWAFDPKKVEIVFKRGNTIQGQQQMAMLDEYYKVLKELPDHMDNTYANVPNKNFESSKLRDIIDNSEMGALESHHKYVDAIQNSKRSLGLGDLAAAGIATTHPLIGAAILSYNVANKPIDYLNKLAAVEKMIGATTQAVGKGAKAIFDPSLRAIGKAKGPLSRLGTGGDIESYKKVHEDLSKLNNDPRYLIDTMSASTKDLNEATPDISSSLQQSSLRAIQFLQSKLPSPPHANPFEQEYTPSKAEMAEFDRYFSVVEDPQNALEQVRNHTIGPEAVEALNAVYPQLYGFMKNAVLEEASNAVAKKQPISYQTKQAISIFLGEPLDSSFALPSIMANQATFLPKAPLAPSKPGSKDMTIADRMSLDDREES